MKEKISVFSAIRYKKIAASKRKSNKTIEQLNHFNLFPFNITPILTTMETTNPPTMIAGWKINSSGFSNFSIWGEWKILNKTPVKISTNAGSVTRNPIML